MRTESVNSEADLDGGVSEHVVVMIIQSLRRSNHDRFSSVWKTHTYPVLASLLMKACTMKIQHNLRMPSGSKFSMLHTCGKAITKTIKSEITNGQPDQFHDRHIFFAMLDMQEWGKP
jgi:hypothetical protein